MKNQKGMSLVEVMVAVVILGSGILGLAALQGRSVAMTQSAHYRGVAADLAADLADRIRANRTPFFTMENSALHTDMSSQLPPNFANCPQNTSNRDAAPTCTSQPGGHQAYMLATEMSEWNAALRAQLPNGRYTLNAVAASAAATNPSSGFYRYTLVITWVDDRTVDAPDFTYTTVIE